MVAEGHTYIVPRHMVICFSRCDARCGSEERPRKPAAARYLVWTMGPKYTEKYAVASANTLNNSIRECFKATAPAGEKGTCRRNESTAPH